LDFRGPVMGSSKSPCSTSYRSSVDIIALNCLVFKKIAFFAFWRQTDRQANIQTNGQTDGHHRCVKPQSRYCEPRLHNIQITISAICRNLRGDPNDEFPRERSRFLIAYKKTLIPTASIPNALVS